ncbi:hypothetical protein TNCV_3661861 [Trichonephila clavipes]|nr:hypothetical protein TNCV_3661861 [Trichonephila clavipes]
MPSNPSPTAPQSASLTTIPDGWLAIFKKSLFYFAHSVYTYYHSPLQPWGRGSGMVMVANAYSGALAISGSNLGVFKDPACTRADAL